MVSSCFWKNNGNGRGKLLTVGHIRYVKERGCRTDATAPSFELKRYCCGWLIRIAFHRCIKAGIKSIEIFRIQLVLYAAKCFPETKLCKWISLRVHRKWAVDEYSLFFCAFLWYICIKIRPDDPMWVTVKFIHDRHMRMVLEKWKKITICRKI